MAGRVHPVTPSYTYVPAPGIECAHEIRRTHAPLRSAPPHRGGGAGARVQPGGARRPARADRALPRSGPLQYPRSCGLSRPSRRSGALVARQSAVARRRRGARARARALASERQGAGRVPRAARAHGREPELAARPRRGLCGARPIRHADDPAAAAARAGERQPAKHRSAAGLPGWRRHHGAALVSQRGLRALLRSVRGVWRVVVACLPSRVLEAVAGAARVRLCRLLPEQVRLASPADRGGESPGARARGAGAVHPGETLAERRATARLERLAQPRGTDAAATAAAVFPARPRVAAAADRAKQFTPLRSHAGTAPPDDGSERSARELAFRSKTGIPRTGLEQASATVQPRRDRKSTRLNSSH